MAIDPESGGSNGDRGEWEDTPEVTNPNEEPEVEATAKDLGITLDDSGEDPPVREATSGLIQARGRMLVEMYTKYRDQPVRQGVSRGVSTDAWLARLQEDALGPFTTLSGDVAALTGGTVKNVEIREREQVRNQMEKDYGGKPEMMTDLVQGVIVYDSLDGLYTALETIDRTQSRHGITILKVKDRIIQPDANGRRDVRLYVRLETGSVAVLRLVLKEIDLYVTASGVSHRDSVQAMEAAAEASPGKAFTPADAEAIGDLRKQEDADITALFVKAWNDSRASAPAEAR